MTQISHLDLTDEEKKLASLFKEQAQNQPFPELQTLAAEITAIQHTITPDIRNMKKASVNRPISPPVPAGYPSYWDGSENTIILCRIVGRNLIKILRFEQYYKEYYNIKKRVRKETNVIIQSNESWVIPKKDAE